ncbi:VCBS repeat-containing protein [Streptomyces sp. NPDC051742]|uniref:FG-GAP repeat domain-containing protein n=1 Tax=unclassified Streptomyces TaxID=2593676 RepID=UPI00341D07F0
MHSVRRPARRRVSAAITTVLAVTLGAGTLAVPATATAAPASVPSAVTAEAGAEAEAPFAFPVDAALLAAGDTGFLSTKGLNGGIGALWTRYADGSTTAVDGMGHIYPTGSDVVASGDASSPYSVKVVKLYDMATGGAPVAIDLGALNATFVRAVSRNAVLAKVVKADRSSEELLLVSRTGSAVTQTKITGIPVGARHIGSTPARDGSVLVDYYADNATGALRSHYAMVDLVTASVVSTHETAPSASYVNNRFSAFSATHLAWSDWIDYHDQEIVTLNRATGVESRINLGYGEALAAGLLGSWAMYGVPTALGGDGRGGSSADVAFRAKSLTSGESVKLLDYVSEVLPGPGGTLLARGGTVEKGVGVYRISLGADGRPVAEMVASTGEPTQLVYLGSLSPRTLDLDAPGSFLQWKLSRINANIDLTVTHRRTGKTFSKEMSLYTESAGSPYLCGDNTVCISWAEIAAESEMGKDAHIGAYDWTFKATPQNGVGPAVEASGGFTAVKTSAPHDIKDNGTPDLLARDGQGVLWRTDTAYDAGRKSLVANGGRVRVGGGWQAYDRIEAVGDIVSRGSADFVARDRDGVLWLYTGADVSLDVTLAPRTRIGGGWNTYTRFTGGSDLTGDGRPDLVATDTAGDLWLYKGTGSATAPFAARKKIGYGWGIYNQITAVGDIGGNPTGDLVARDKYGVLWTYLGKGDGTFAPRTKIGGGWGAYTDSVGIGDGNKDGRPDLYVYGPGGAAYFYPGTGDYKAPFGARVASGALLGDGVSYNGTY